MPSLPYDDAPGWPELGCEVIPIDEAAAEYLTAQETSSELARVLSAGTTLAELSAALEAEYGADPDRAAADIDEFLAQLGERGARVE